VTVGRRFVLRSRPVGLPVDENFLVETFEPSAAAPGHVLVATRLLSLDPYMRGRLDDRPSYATPTRVGGVVPAQAVAEVTASADDAYEVGDIVIAPTGWATHALVDVDSLRPLPVSDLDPGVALGVLGMPGFTAYAGLRLVGGVRPGTTVVVGAATGPVGSLVGQLARAAGARAVGIAGGSAKCDLARRHFGFDTAVDHRAPDFAARLAAECPEGVDLYFENIGGSVWDAVLPLLNQFARIPVCGLAAHYNATDETAPAATSARLLREVLSKSLRIQGYINHDHRDWWNDFIRDVAPRVRARHLAYLEHREHGFDRIPATFSRMLRGANVGKTIVEL
jgi:NADPH-dependent curcumin reductase CurA